MNILKFEDIKDMTFIRIEGMEEGSQEVKFYTNDYRVFTMTHHQSCCESVDIEDVCGNVEDLLNTPIIRAVEASNKTDFYDEKWTFYTIYTIKGNVTIRWYGTSNGYYSVDVSFYENTTT